MPLSDKTFAVADDQYLRDSILLPNKQTAAGYAQWASAGGEAASTNVLINPAFAPGNVGSGIALNTFTSPILGNQSMANYFADQGLSLTTLSSISTVK